MKPELKTPTDWFAAGRIMACQKMPYFSAAVMGLVPHQMPGLGTLGVTAKGVLMWDPGLHQRWTIENLAWVLLHEAGHYLRDHAGRQKACAAEHSLWNIAGDAEINDDLIDAGAVFPAFAKEDGVDDDKIGQPSGVTPGLIGCEDGKLCEEYYAHLRKHAKVIKVGVVSMRAGVAQGGGKDSQGQGQGSGTGDVTIVVQVGGGKSCGSGAGQEPSQNEAQVPQGLGKSTAEQKRIQRAVAEAVRSASQKGRGNVPAGLQRWAEDILGPSRIPWQQKLARACRAAVAFRPGAGDYRYDRPSRRQGAFGYGTGSPVFPALRMPIPQVAVISDTSGSMGEAELKVGLEEVKGILSAVGAEIAFYACDAEVHSAVRVRTVQQAIRATKGGGGTDMRPAFEAAMGAHRKPEVIVCVTDGQIGDPGPKPHGIHVVWLVVGAYGNANLPWGEVIKMESGPEAPNPK